MVQQSKILNKINKNKVYYYGNPITKLGEQYKFSNGVEEDGWFLSHFFLNVQ
jgi:hypothetical protein